MVSRIHEPAEHCQDRRDEIIEYVFDEMGPGAAGAFEAHLASCPGCTAEVTLLRGTITLVEEASPASFVAEGSANGQSGSTISLEEEWALLRRRLRFPEVLVEAPASAGWFGRARTWLPAAAAVILVALLSFAAGWLWRGETPGSVASATGGGPAARPGGGAAPPVAGASAGNYFDHFEDFTRDTHNCLRRTRMILMEFTNLGEDSDPSFFRTAAGRLLEEVDRYRAVAGRMNNSKLAELLDEISGILSAISSVRPDNQTQVIADVRLTLELTSLIAKLELLDAAVERRLEGPPNA